MEILFFLLVMYGVFLVLKGAARAAGSNPQATMSLGASFWKTFCK